MEKLEELGNNPGTINLYFFIYIYIYSFLLFRKSAFRIGSDHMMIQEVNISFSILIVSRHKATKN